MKEIPVQKKKKDRSCEKSSKSIIIKNEKKQPLYPDINTSLIGLHV